MKLLLGRSVYCRWLAAAAVWWACIPRWAACPGPASRSHNMGGWQDQSIILQSAAAARGGRTSDAYFSPKRSLKRKQMWMRTAASPAGSLSSPPSILSYCRIQSVETKSFQRKWTRTSRQSCYRLICATDSADGRKSILTFARCVGSYFSKIICFVIISFIIIIMVVAMHLSWIIIELDNKSGN